MARMPATDVRLARSEPLTKRELVENNVALVEHIVNRLLARLSGRHDREELVRVGSLGLVEAASRYDASREIPFAAFAGLRIEGAILDHLRSSDWMPRGLRQWEREISRAVRRLEDELARTPTDAEIAEALELTTERLKGLRRRIHPAELDSLERPVGGPASEVRLADVIADTAPAASDDLDDRELRYYVRECLDLLSDRHRFVVVGCLLEGRSLREMADLMGVTRSRVAQLKDDALGLIREAVEAQYREPAEPGVAEPRRRSRSAAMAAQLAQRAAAHQRMARLSLLDERPTKAG